MPSSGPIAWGAAPFPSDLFLGEDGTVDLASLPSTTPLWEGVREVVNERRGFCGTCPIHFPIRGAIDPITLQDGTVVMISPSGAEVPIELEWNALDSVIAVRPRRGIVLEPGAAYVVALTTAIRGVDGSVLRADEGFGSERAKQITTPALETLEAAGYAERSIVGLTRFTVEDPTLLTKDLARRVQQYVYLNGPPTVVVDQVWRASDSTLDQLMGIPAQDRPGLDVPAIAGSVGTFGVTHSSLSIVIRGRFSSVRVITGSGSDLGTPQPDTVAGDSVPFVLAIPAGVDVTRMPVVVFHHGATGMLAQSLELADAAGRAGAAFLALEHFQHGARAPSAVDVLHNLRGDPGTLGPDGFAEHTPTSVALRLFAVNGTPSSQVCSPVYLLGTLSQMVADLHAFLTVVRSSDLASLAAADASLAGLAFDQERVFFVGLSLGTLVGTTTLVADTTVSSAAFNVPIGGIVETLADNAEFRQQVDLLMLRPLDIGNSEFEPARRLSMHPLIAFQQWVLHPTEPTALAPHLARRTNLDLLWQLAGLDELAGVAAADGLIAATGVPAIGTYDHAPVTPGVAPIRGRGAYRFAQADHFMIGFTEGVSKVLPPGLPPFESRPAPLMFANPVADVQAQLTHFWTTRRTTGVGEISAP